jgi:hypothetical protein
MSKSEVSKLSRDVDIEKIEVVGKRPLNQLFKIRNEKREAFMDEFNNLVSDEDLHFECRRETPTGSHISKSVCRNVFDWRIIDEIVETEIKNGNPFSAYAVALQGNREQRERKQDLLKTINKMLEENSVFAAIFEEFNDADGAYKNGHAEKFGQLSPYNKKQNGEKQK